MGLVEDLINHLRNFQKLIIFEPESEKALCAMLYIYLRMLDYDVIYTGGKAQADLVVRGENTEIPIEVKKTSTSSTVDDGIEQLFEYMKGTEWKKGILFVLDVSRTGTVYSRAEEIESVTKYRRTVYVVAIRIQI